MEVIKRKDGARRYREELTINGIRFRSPTFRRKYDAKQWKAKKLVERDEAKRLGHEYQKRERINFQDFAELWLNNKIKTQRTQSTYNNHKRTLNLHFFPVIGNLFLDQITSNHADKIVKYLLSSGHNENGTNKLMQVFKSVMLEAENSDYIRKSPLKNYPILKVKKRPPTFWTDMEVRQFLQANISNALYPLFVVALNTGMRRGEIAGLCWDKVDFQRSIIEVSRIRDRYGLRSTTKTGIVRYVPINDAAKATLLKLFNKRCSKFVFESSNGTPIEVQHIYRDFKKAQKLAEMDRLIRFHDLRHCFASHFMMNNGNLYDLQKILGHTNYGTTQIYAHLSPDYLAGTTQIINFGANIEKE